MQKKDRYIVIMAGGRGERFWPVSRERKPKQLITLLGNRSFLQQTVDRVKPIVPLENILIITNAVQAASVRKQLTELPNRNIIGEPCGRDTCAAVALGAALVGGRSENAVMAVLPADHVIPDEARFRSVLLDSMRLAKREPALVTIGIKPHEPATGYGYIQTGTKLRSTTAKALKSTFSRPKNSSKNRTSPPPSAISKAATTGGTPGCLSGRTRPSRTSCSDCSPSCSPSLKNGGASAACTGLNAALAKDYPGLEKISVDYAIMENARNIVCADGVFGWDDLGSWPALARHVRADKAGNSSVADLVQIDSADNVIFDARTRNRTPIAMVGMSETIVVQTDDATMVAAKSESQKIKQLVALLANDKRFAHLV